MEKDNSKVKELPQENLRAHFSHLSPEARKNSIEPILDQNKDSSFIFKIKGKTYHIIFAFENREGIKIDRNKLPKKDEFKRDEDIKNIAPISKTDQGVLRPNVQEISRVFMECLADALKFSSWTMEEKFNGFTVDGHTIKAFGMASNFGVLGVKVSASQAIYLNEELRFIDSWAPKDAEKRDKDIRVFISTSIVHELSHHESTSEPLAYLRDITYALINYERSLPTKMLDEIQDVLKKVYDFYENPRKRGKHPGRLTEDHRSRYAAAITIASILSETNKKIEEEFLRDTTDYKRVALKKLYSDMSSDITEEGLKQLYGRYSKKMSKGELEKRVIEDFRIAAKKFNIKNAESFIPKDESEFYGARRST